MEPNTTNYTFKIGDWVTIISDRVEEYVGLKGVIHKYFETELPFREADGCWVKIEGFKLKAGTDNNIVNNTRAMYFRELKIDKNAIVSSILKDL